MARALPNVKSGFVNPAGTALKNEGRNATRRYLRSQIRELDILIEALILTQTDESWYVLERAAWSQPAAAKIVWTGRLELHYLICVRAALVETLTRL